MSTHRAVAITAVGSLKVIDLPTPTPGPDEVLIHGFALSEGDYPRVVGFVSAGFVKAVRENVKYLQEGDRVTAYNFPDTKDKAAQE